MQQQQYHTCNNINIMHATAAILRMQQQQFHACNGSHITHATHNKSSTCAINFMALASHNAKENVLHLHV